MLTLYLNKSILCDRSISISQLKLTEVIPIFKKKGGIPTIQTTTDPSQFYQYNFKIFEKIASNQILYFFKYNNIFFSCLFGFRPKKTKFQLLLHWYSRSLRLWTSHRRQRVPSETCPRPSRAWIT